MLSGDAPRPHCGPPPSDDPNKEPSWIESVLIGKGSNLALAVLCGKVLVPIKIPLAVAITPYVHR